MVPDNFQKSWFFDDFAKFYQVHHLEESASHPFPLPEGVPQVIFESFFYGVPNVSVRHRDPL